MRISKEIIEDVLILKVSGKLVSADETIALHDEIKNLATGGNKKIVLELSGIQNINSTGMDALMASKTTLDKVDGHFRLANVSEKVEVILNITKMGDYLDVSKDIETAVTLLKKIYL